MGLNARMMGGHTARNDRLQGTLSNQWEKSSGYRCTGFKTSLRVPQDS